METLEQTTTMPRIGDKAPEFKAITTQGEINFPTDYKGKWIILFSHPADFTPVCTSEFMTFAKMEPEFTALNCQLVGLSIDGLYSHIAWLRTIKEKIEFKGIADFKASNIVNQSPFLQNLNAEKDDYQKIMKQLKTNKLVKGVLENPDAKAAFMSALQSLIVELDNNK